MWFNLLNADSVHLYAFWLRRESIQTYFYLFFLMDVAILIGSWFLNFVILFPLPVFQRRKPSLFMPSNCMLSSNGFRSIDTDVNKIQCCPRRMTSYLINILQNLSCAFLTEIEIYWFWIFCFLVNIILLILINFLY